MAKAKRATCVNEEVCEKSDISEKGAVVPFDRLPVAGYFGQPPKASPYHTKRAETMRQKSIGDLPRDKLDAAIQVLAQKGQFGVNPKGYKGVFEHNCITLAAAQTYAEYGLKVMDLHGIQEDGKQTGPQKSCKIPRGAKWDDRASCDPKEINDFWIGNGSYPPDKKGSEYGYADRRQPRNVGIVISPEMLVFDIDGQIGKASLAALEKEHGPLPKTWACNTGSGGQHFYFTYPAGFDIRNSASAIAPSIDIRANGGFVVAPPSIHPTGNFYDWADGCAPWECEITEAPEWLVKAALEATKSRSKPKNKSKKKASSLKTARPAKASGKGFKAHLKSIGDGDGYQGFDTPIYKAGCAWFGEQGANADCSSLKADLTHAILAAPCEDDRAESRYAGDNYLDNRIEQARDYIRSQEMQIVEDDIYEEMQADIQAPLYNEDLVEDGVCDFEDVSEVENQIRNSMRARFTNVIMDGGDTRVFLPTQRGKPLRYWKASALPQYFKNQSVRYFGDDDKWHQINPAELFSYDRERVNYVGTCFEPDTTKADDTAFNIWNGFVAESTKGDWSLLNTHILDNICSGNKTHYNWLMTYLADIFQNPGHKYGSSIAITGEQGTGKSKLFDWVRVGIGAAALKVAARNRLTGNFNGHFDGIILVVAEEAFWSGDKSAAGVLKDYISSDSITIERKGLDIVIRANYMRFIFISNESWVIPTDDGDARRFFVLKCGNAQKQNTDYFRDIDAQMNNGGLEAMVHDLMQWDPEDHNLTWDALRKPPQTDARSEQAGYGLTGPKARLIDIIREGEFTGRLVDGTVFHYSLDSDEETPVLRKHLNAVLSDGKATNGGAGKRLMESVEGILGKSANQGDSKKKITYLGDFADDHLDGEERERESYAESGRWYAIPALDCLQKQVNEKFGE